MTERGNAAESTVYLGRELAGSIVIRRKGEVLALDARGRRIGTFRTDREAMRVVLAAARATLEAKR